MRCAGRQYSLLIREVFRSVETRDRWSPAIRLGWKVWAAVPSIPSAAGRCCGQHGAWPAVRRPAHGQSWLPGSRPRRGKRNHRMSCGHRLGRHARAQSRRQHRQPLRTRQRGPQPLTWQGAGPIPHARHRGRARWHGRGRRRRSRRSAQPRPRLKPAVPNRVGTCIRASASRAAYHWQGACATPRWHHSDAGPRLPVRCIGCIATVPRSWCG
jgi:hypothetical protein